MNRSKFIASIFDGILDAEEKELLTTLLEEKDNENGEEKSLELNSLNKLLSKKGKK